MNAEQLGQFAGALLQLATAVLLACAPFVAAWAAARARDWLVRNHLLEFARVAVLAAEQLKISEKINDKKTWAVRWLTDALRQRGVSLPVGEIEAAIEAAVMEQFNQTPTIKAEKTVDLLGLVAERAKAEVDLAKSLGLLSGEKG
jgi:hypothetical protein